MNRRRVPSGDRRRGNGQTGGWTLRPFFRAGRPDVDGVDVASGWRSLRWRTLRANRLALATAGTLVTAAAGQMFLLISGPLVARLLGVDDRGHFAWLTAWAGIILIVGHFGTSWACGYYVSRYPTQTRQILRTASLLYVVQSIALTFVLWVVLLFVASDDAGVASAIPATLALVPAALLHIYVMSFLQAQQRFLTFNLIRLAPSALYAAAMVALFLADVDQLDVVVWVWTATQAIPALVGLLLVFARLPPEHDREPRQLRRILSFAARGSLSTTSPLDLPIDQLVIGAVLSAASLGLWVVGSAFRNLPAFIGQSVGMVAYPAAAALTEAKDGWRLVWRFLGVVTVLMVPLTVLLIALMPKLVELFFGAQFADASSIGRLLVLGAFFASLRRVLLDGLRGTGHPGHATLAELAMYPWLLVGGALLLWQYEADGLAAAIAIGYAICFFFALASALRLSRRAHEARVVPSLSSVSEA